MNRILERVILRNSHLPQFVAPLCVSVVTSFHRYSVLQSLPKKWFELQSDRPTYLPTYPPTYLKACQISTLQTLEREWQFALVKHVQIRTTQTKGQRAFSRKSGKSMNICAASGSGDGCDCGKAQSQLMSSMFETYQSEFRRNGWNVAGANLVGKIA